MKEFTFSIPQKIIVGKGALEKVGQISVDLDGKHAFIISGPNLEKMGIVSKVEGLLNEVSIDADSYTNIEANPSVTTACSVAQKYPLAILTLPHKAPCLPTRGNVPTVLYCFT